MANSQNKNTKNNAGPRLSWVRVVVFVVIAVIVGVSFLFTAPIERLLNTNSSISTDTEQVEDGDLQVHYVYVGQGNATVIKFPDGKVMMIDTGLTSSVTVLENYLNNIIFKNSANKEINYMVLTHTDSDHVGGAAALLKDYTVDTVYRPDVASTYTGSGITADPIINTALYSVSTKVWGQVVTAMYQKAGDVEVLGVTFGLITAFGYQITNGQYTFSFYGPVRLNYKDNNDFCPIMVLNYNNKSYMFTGDASKSVEQEVINYVQANLGDAVKILHTDVLEVGHHGSNTATSTQLMDTIGASYAVISCGINNQYGFPTNNTLETLKHYYVQVLRTDLNGDIISYVDAGGKLNFIMDVYTPNGYYIRWSYIAVVILVVSGVICFIPKRRYR